MAISSCTLLLLLLAIRGSIQKSDPASLTYRAAVVEFKPFEYTNDSDKTLSDNAEKIVSFIEEAAQREADIVVFPELCLSSLSLGQRPEMVARSILVPDPYQNYRPCTDSSIPVHEVLKRIACAVERSNIYVVVNLLEKDLCLSRNCPNDGIFVYVTSAVFDRKGTIIARSRKAHLVDEYDVLNVMGTPELTTFDTDFGVTFGSIICFDIMFEKTWQRLRQLNITDIVHASGWASEMPFLTTIQTKSGWAYAEDVNLLSSGYNHIEWGNSGSGIYAGRQGVVAAVLPLDHHDELLVANVWKKNKKTGLISTAQDIHEHDLRPTNRDQNHHIDGTLPRKLDSGHFKWRYEVFDDFKSILIAENGFMVERLSHIGIDCEFQVNITNLTPLGVTYRLLAFDGVHHFGKSVKAGKRICAIVLCANNTIESCGHIWDTPVTLNSINITAVSVNDGRTLMMPSTLGTDMLPLKNWTWEQYEQNEHVHTSISLTMPTQNLITFGFWGRKFERDDESAALLRAKHTLFRV